MIKTLREKRGLTQKELAEALGFGAQLISNIERGKQQLPVKHYKKAAKVLRVPVDLLIDMKLKATRAKLLKAFGVK